MTRPKPVIDWRKAARNTQKSGPAWDCRPETYIPRSNSRSPLLHYSTDKTNCCLYYTISFFNCNYINTSILQSGFIYVSTNKHKKPFPNQLKKAARFASVLQTAPVSVTTYGNAVLYYQLIFIAVFPSASC